MDYLLEIQISVYRDTDCCLYMDDRKDGRGQSLTIQISCVCRQAAAAKLLQSCQTLCDPRDGSLPGASASGILQARTLEWVAISFSNARE